MYDNPEQAGYDPDQYPNFPAVGQVFNFLTVTGYASRDHRGTTRICCRCRCGSHHDVAISHLLSSRVKSCGCSKKKYKLYDRQTYKKEYVIWQSMKARCNNKNHKSYPVYGGKGISVHQSWAEDFEEFMRYIGAMPTPEHTLDRFPDKSGNYEPGNVRWATMSEQCRNKGNNRVYEFDGKLLCVADIADSVGMSYNTLYNRLARGWPMSKAITFELKD